MIRVVAVLAAIAIAAPAAATVTIQTRTISLGSLDVAPINGVASFFNFTSFGLTGEHLTSVTIDINAKANGTVSATNNATGGTVNSRKRDITASYTLNGSVGGNGLSASGTNTDPQTRANVAGNGTVVTLNSINPKFVASDTATSGFAPFVSGPVQFSYSADALFASVAAPNVVFGAPDITGGRAILTLTFDSVIPEPATWAMLITGFGLVGVSLRRRAVATA